jgi:hypothetical protein
MDSSAGDADEMVGLKMVSEKKTWNEFREAGLLWWVNRALHLFGWAITLVQADDGTISDAYPARCKFRGFSQDSETQGFIKVSAYLKENGAQLLKEAKE